MEDALSRIAEAHAALEEVRKLLRQMNEHHEKRNILRRYDAICARVPDSAEEPQASQLKERLTTALQKLEEILQLHFRNPAPLVSPQTT